MDFDLGIECNVFNARLILGYDHHQQGQETKEVPQFCSGGEEDQ